MHNAVTIKTQVKREIFRSFVADEIRAWLERNGRKLKNWNDIAEIRKWRERRR